MVKGYQSQDRHRPKLSCCIPAHASPVAEKHRCLPSSGVCDTLATCAPDSVSDDGTEQGSEPLQSRAEHQQGGVATAVVVNSCGGAMNGRQSWLGNIWARLPRLPPCQRLLLIT